MQQKKLYALLCHCGILQNVLTKPLGVEKGVSASYIAGLFLFALGTWFVCR
jgi:hypothetical protein